MGLAISRYFFFRNKISVLTVIIFWKEKKVVSLQGRLENQL